MLSFVDKYRDFKKLYLYGRAIILKPFSVRIERLSSRKFRMLLSKASFLQYNIEGVDRVVN